MKKFTDYVEDINEAMSDEARALQNEKGALYRKIRGMKQRGKDTTQLEKEYAELCARYEAAKSGKSVSTPPQTPSQSPAGPDINGLIAKGEAIADLIASQIQSIVQKNHSNEKIDKSIIARYKAALGAIISKQPRDCEQVMNAYKDPQEFTDAIYKIGQKGAKKDAADLLDAMNDMLNYVIRSQATNHNAHQSGSGSGSGGRNGSTGSGSNNTSKTGNGRIDPNSDDYKAGYEAAMKAIEEMEKNKGKNQGNQNSGNSDSGLGGIPMDPEDMDQGSSSSSSSSGSKSGKQNKGGSKGNSSGTSRDSANNPNQGVVRPEDCADPSRSLQNCPGTAGGMIGRDAGDKLAESEGYSKEGPGDEACAKDWAERAQQAASKMAGKGAGWEQFAAKIRDLYKVTKDWKKELRNIVGHSINAEDKRQAYANKNVLVAQQRIARTDKDKYDNMDYMIAAIDTSGSMTQDFLEACLREVYQVALAKKPIKLVICQFDDRITDIKEYTSIPQLMKDIKGFKMKGGGGTEVKPLWDMLRNDRKFKGRRAELVMIFTDGYLTQYKRDMRTMQNLCWVVIDNPGFEPQFKDACTKCVRIKQSDIK